MQYVIEIQRTAPYFSDTQFLVKAAVLFSVYSETGIDLIFMLDGAVNNRIYGWMKNFVRNFASQLPVDTGEYRVGAMTYTTSPNGQFQLNRYNFQDEVSCSVFSSKWSFIEFLSISLFLVLCAQPCSTRLIVIDKML